MLASQVGVSAEWSCLFVGIGKCCDWVDRYASLTLFPNCLKQLAGADRPAWPLVVNFCCPQGATSETCTKADNMGWRYLYIIIGCLCLIMSIVRSFALGMTESPKWLISQGNLDEAVASVNIISRLNKSSFVLSVEELQPCERENPYDMQRTLRLVQGLFTGSKQLRSMICLILLWVLVGVAYVVCHSFFLRKKKKIFFLKSNQPDTQSTSFSSPTTSKPTAPNSAPEAPTRPTATGPSPRQ